MTDPEFLEHLRSAAEKLPEDALSARLALSLAMEHAKERFARLERLERKQSSRDATITELARQMVNAMDRLKALDVVDALETAGVEVVQLGPQPRPLRLVQTGRCPDCGTKIGTPHYAGCSVDLVEHRPEGA